MTKSLEPHIEAVLAEFVCRRCGYRRHSHSGSAAKKTFGLQDLLEFQWQATVGGEFLTDDAVAALAEASHSISNQCRTGASPADRASASAPGTWSGTHIPQPAGPAGVMFGV